MHHNNCILQRWSNRKIIVWTFLLVSAVVSTMLGSLGKVDCLYSMDTLLDLTGFPYWLMISWLLFGDGG